MFNTSITRLLALSAVLVVSACAGWEERGDPKPKPPLSDPPFTRVTEDPYLATPHESRFYINGVPVPLNGQDLAAIKQNPIERERFIDRLIDVDDSIEKIPDRDDFLIDLSNVFKEDDNDKIEKRIYSRDPESKSVYKRRAQERVSGLGGFQSRLLLYYMLKCTPTQLADLGEVRVYGKIKRWIYDQKAKPPTYKKSKKRKKKGSGYIFWHAMADECDGTPHDFKFHIALDNGYDLLRNIATEKYHLDFGDEEINNMIPQEERDILIRDERQFNYKLHAQGRRIYILTVFLDNDLVDAEDPIYNSDRYSCIDIFFEYEPPANELPEQFGYCMGRCDHPPILNTSGD